MQKRCLFFALANLDVTVQNVSCYYLLVFEPNLLLSLHSILSIDYSFDEYY